MKYINTTLSMLGILVFSQFTACGGSGTGPIENPPDPGLTDDEKFLMDYVDSTGEMSSGDLTAKINYNKDVYSSSSEIENLPAIGHVSDNTIVLYCGPGKQTPADADIVTECAGNSKSHLYWWCHEDEEGGSVGYSFDGGVVFTHTYPEGETFGYVSCNGSTYSYGFGNLNEFDNSVSAIAQIVIDNIDISLTSVDPNLENYSGSYYAEEKLNRQYGSCTEISDPFWAIDVNINVDDAGALTTAEYLWSGTYEMTLQDQTEENITFDTDSNCTFTFYTGEYDDTEQNYLYAVCTIGSQKCDDYYIGDICALYGTCGEETPTSTDTTGSSPEAYVSSFCGYTKWSCDHIIPHGSFIDGSGNYFEY